MRSYLTRRSGHWAMTRTRVLMRVLYAPSPGLSATVRQPLVVVEMQKLDDALGALPERCLACAGFLTHHSRTGEAGTPTSCAPDADLTVVSAKDQLRGLASAVRGET